MDYEKFKQDMEQDVLKNLANRGIEAETDVRHIDKLNDGYDALTVKAPGSVIGVNINLSSAFAAYEDGRDYIDIVERASDQADKGNHRVEEFRYRYGYSENEIARIEGVSQPAVHDSIQAGLKKLKYMLNW